MSEKATIITVKPDVELGVWQGMGGAITEATAYNFAKLSPAKQQELLYLYYGKDRLDYRWARLSIGSNDFCLEPFQYTRKRDLSDFSIDHDRKWLLPMLKQVLKQKDLKILASPWSPPSCLKTTHMTRFGGHLKPWSYRRYAEYLRKWLDAYAKEGIKVDYLSPQNEPKATQKWESCRYSFRALRRLSYQYLANLGPQLLLWDHNKRRLDEVADRLFNGKYVTEYGRDKAVAGLCFHWYTGTHPEKMWQVRQKYPDITMISSEMCCGYSPYDEHAWFNDALGYLREIFADINCGASAWIDWNMLLSWQGGPSYCKNYVKAPIILNEAEDDFIVTPIYSLQWGLAEKFPAGSKVVRCEFTSDKIAAIARKTAQGYEVVVANLDYGKRSATIRLGDKEKTISLTDIQIKTVKL